MAMFERHVLEQQGDSYTVTIYLDQGLTEFAKDLGNNNNGTQDRLADSVRKYVGEKFPNLKVTAAKVMLGSMMVASIPLGAMTAQAAEAPTAPPPAVTAEATTAATVSVLPDVKGTKYEEAVTILQTIGVVAGKDDGKYHSADGMSRAEFAKFAVYAAGYGEAAETIGRTSTGFSDVAADYWGSGYIKVAKEKGLMEGTGYNQFNPLGQISYEEVVTVLQRIQGYNDENLGGNWPTNYVNLATENGINANTDFAQGKLADRGNAAILLRNILEKPTVAYNSQTNKFEPQQTLFERAFGDKFILKDGQVFAVDKAPYSFVNAAANSAKSLKVTFNKPVTNIDDVTFTVNRGASTIALTPTWSADKMSVVLGSDVKLTAGQYNVRAEGLRDVGTLNSTIAVQAEKVASIEIVGGKLIKTTDPKIANATYKVFNQYNEDVTRDPIANSISWNATVSLAQGQSVTDDNKGKIEVPAAAALRTGDTVVLTGIDPNTGTVATKTMEVADMASITSIKFGNLIYPQGVDKVFAQTAGAVKIPFEAIDQYGNKIVSENELNSALDRFPSAGTFNLEITDDGPMLVFNSPETAQKVVLTMVAKATGATANLTLDVVAKPAPATIDAAQYDKVIAAEDGAGSIVMPITITDQFGNTMTPDQIVAAKANDKIRITASGALANASFDIKTTGPDKGKIYNQNPVGETTGPAVIMVTLPDTGKTSMQTLTVSAKRVLTDLVAPKDVPTNLLQGATHALKFQFKDQYGETISPSAQSPDYTYQLTLKKVSGDDGAIQVLSGGNPVEVGTPIADELQLKNLTVKSVSGLTGSYRITAELIKEGSTISSSNITFSSFAATGDLTYTVADLPTVFKGATASDSAYATPLNITATDAQGRAYVINPNDIVSVTDTKGLVAYNPTTQVLFVKNTAGLTQDTSTTVKVVFNTADEVKTISKDLTIAVADPTLQSFKLISSATAPTDGSSTLPTGATTQATLTGSVGAAGAVSFGDGVTSYLVGQDQYGVYHNLTNNDLMGNKLTVTNVTGVTYDTVSLGANGALQVSGVQFAEGKSSGSLRIIATTDKGAVANYTINLTKGDNYSAPAGGGE